MRRPVRAAASAAALFLAAGAAQAADPPGPNVAARAAQPTASSTAVEQAHLAAELAAYGRQARNPMALVLAAELTAATAGPAAERAKTTKGTATEGPAKTARPATTVSALLDEARAMAGPDATLAPAIQRVAAMESKGGHPGRGPGYARTRVLAGQTDVFTERFRGGEPAIVAVRGDGDTDLDLFVYDQNGNQVCSDTDDTDTAVCQWTPAWTGSFRVEVKNHGRVYNEYVIRTN